MNAVEIEQAITELAELPFDGAEFPFAFLEAFGNKATTIKKLRSGASNKSDIDGVLQSGHIHLKTCDAGHVPQTLTDLKDSKATQTKRNKVRFLLATDGQTFEAEDLLTGDTVSCTYTDFPNHFVFFWPLAGLSKTKQLSESEFDVRATLRLNKLYTTLRADNPDWEGRSHDMNHFMARLIFLFFAEDTDILNGEDLFTDTIERMANADGSNTHEVISELFRAMNTDYPHRDAADLPRWATPFPYVNGGLFSGSTDVPKFSRIAQRYLTHIGHLDWTKINPDIFGSMIQAVADEEERSTLGMHYTSVPNILKVLNPLFLDDLRDHLDRAEDSPQKLLNLRKRMSNIRVFDPACGSGNFLVIAYKQMREIEFEINKRRGEAAHRSEIRIQNFRGIELRDFSAEIARLALIIAEYQCDVTYRGQKDALAEFLPLDKQNWITCGNALQLDWLSICHPTETTVRVRSNDLLATPLDQAEIDFDAVSDETYICGNPPYLGSQDQSPEQKRDLKDAFEGAIKSTKSADYVTGWFIKARRYVSNFGGQFAFVTTNSICQGRQVALFWPAFLQSDLEITFAEPSFLWSNLATKKAAVIVSIIGIGPKSSKPKRIYSDGQSKTVGFIGPYLVPDHDTVVASSRKVLSTLTPMSNGSMPNDGGGLLMSAEEYRQLSTQHPDATVYCRQFLGSHDSINGEMRYCIWIEDDELQQANLVDPIAKRIHRVKLHRNSSDREETRKLAEVSHAFGERRHRSGNALLIPRHSSETRPYLPSVLVNDRTVVGDSAIAMYGFLPHELAIYSSALHLVWVATVCGKIKTDYRYSNTLGWNTFPVPKLTEKNKADLTRCAEDILLAREAHFPATIADLYKPDAMPQNLRDAHEANDEVLERIYIGRRFKNDTERLEKLFDMYTKMTTQVPA